MAKTLNLHTDVPSTRKVLIALPPDVPTGPAEIVMTISSVRQLTPHTLGELAASEYFGMWSKRSDIKDSVDFARKLRTEAWKRPA